MFVKLPMLDRTFRNISGRSHATVNAQIPPELEPQIARISGSAVKLYSWAKSGRISSQMNRAYCAPIES